MGTGTLAMCFLLGSIGAGEPPFPMKDRTISIPYNLSQSVNPAEVSEVILYVSIDQGRVWSRAGVIRPTERAFPFQAPTDGVYWFNVGVMYRDGKQIPADVSQSPPQQKVLFDTQKPSVRFVSAERMNDDVVIQWEIQESNPDLSTLKLEYRPTDAGAGGFWYSAPVSPGLAGQARFRPNSQGPITVKLSIMDTAGNLGWNERPVNAGTGNGNTAGVTPINNTNVMQTTAFNSQSHPQQPLESLTPPPSEPLPSVGGPVALATSHRTNVPVVSPKLDAPPIQQTNVNNARMDLPEIVFTNEPQVTVDYEIERQGPSGISKVEVFLTQDEGRTWMKWQELTRNEQTDIGPATSLPVTIRLPEREGLYGFRIVPFSGSQLSAGSPQSGEVPEVRVQLDKSMPHVDLYKPEADPKDPNVLILQWKAGDTNLTRSPIKVFYSDNPNGEWKAVSMGMDASLPNTGKHAWVLPPNMPLKVYLKITAEDKAGNVGEAVTPQPIVVDLHKPVGRVKSVQKVQR